MKPPFLSLCLIVRNEASNLPRCIESLRHYADEILIGDTGSIDDTPKIAASLGASVHNIPWQNDFSAARNALLKHAKGRYILFPDADMFLAPQSTQALHDLLNHLRSLPPDHPHPPAFRLLVNDLEPSGNHGMSYLFLRLFPNLPSIRFRWPVHEQIEESIQEINLPIHNTNITLLHTGYMSQPQKLEKQKRNLSILYKILAQPSPP
ncbi:MAG: glycosyltransferase family 2 protein, partial [Chthoniobacterales bacterium]|nr:glycosyltransferase family 2 protein [Chthoniobacterales bacterium]